MEGSSSASRRLASMSWSLDRFGPGGGGGRNMESEEAQRGIICEKSSGRRR